MPAPLSLARVEEAILRLQPPIANSDTSSSALVRELKCVAWVVARAVDYWERLLPALLLEDPGLLERWESMLRLGAHPTELLAARAARVQPVLRRRLAYSRTRLASILAPLLGVTPEQLEWIEIARVDIEAGIRYSRSYTGGQSIATGATPGWDFPICSAWPGKVDDVGVELRFSITTADTTDITVELVHASGASWVAWNQLDGILTDVVIWERSVFRGLPARGPWSLRISSTGAHGPAHVDSFALMASNDVDSDHIYRGYCLRDVSLGVTTDLGPAQRMLESAGIAHVDGRVVERSMLLCDDTRSLLDREPIGG